MLINPFVAVAAVAARAVANILPRSNYNYSGESSYREMFPTNTYFEDNMMDDYDQYFTCIEEDQFYDDGEEAQYLEDFEEAVYEQKKELDDFLVKAAAVDAEIVSKDTQEGTSAKSERSRTKPPSLSNTNNPFRLLGLEPGANFDLIKRTYKELVKVYHPDVVVGPDASPEERKEANWDFARINSAYDILKRKENDEVLEYTVFIDGKYVTQSVDVSEDSRRRDPYHVNYDRIREMTEYRKRHPKERLWYEEDHNYAPWHNTGFEKSKSKSHHRGKWWTDQTFGHGSYVVDHTKAKKGWGPISSRESTWPSAGGCDDERFGFIEPQQKTGWDDSFEYEAQQHQTRHGQRFDARRNEGNPYKGTLGNGESTPWNDEKFNNNDVDGSGNYAAENSSNRFDYDPNARWWRGDEGDFAP